jgi:hypothetical protein
MAWGEEHGVDAVDILRERRHNRRAARGVVDRRDTEW